MPVFNNNSDRRKLLPRPQRQRSSSTSSLLPSAANDEGLSAAATTVSSAVGGSSLSRLAPVKGIAGAPANNAVNSSSSRFSTQSASAAPRSASAGAVTSNAGKRKVTCVAAAGGNSTAAKPSYPSPTAVQTVAAAASAAAGGGRRGAAPHGATSSVSQIDRSDGGRSFGGVSSLGPRNDGSEADGDAEGRMGARRRRLTSAAGDVEEGEGEMPASVLSPSVGVTTTAANGLPYNKALYVFDRSEVVVGGMPPIGGAAGALTSGDRTAPHELSTVDTAASALGIEVKEAGAAKRSSNKTPSSLGGAGGAAAFSKYFLAPRPASSSSSSVAPSFSGGTAAAAAHVSKMVVSERGPFDGAGGGGPRRVRGGGGASSVSSTSAAATASEGKGKGMQQEHRVTSAEQQPMLLSESPEPSHRIGRSPPRSPLPPQPQPQSTLSQRVASSSSVAPSPSVGTCKTKTATPNPNPEETTSSSTAETRRERPNNTMHNAAFAISAKSSQAMAAIHQRYGRLNDALRYRAFVRDQCRKRGGIDSSDLAEALRLQIRRGGGGNGDTSAGAGNSDCVNGDGGEEAAAGINSSGGGGGGMAEIIALLAAAGEDAGEGGDAFRDSELFRALKRQAKGRRQSGGGRRDGGSKADSPANGGSNNDSSSSSSDSGGSEKPYCFDGSKPYKSTLAKALGLAKGGKGHKNRKGQRDVVLRKEDMPLGYDSHSSSGSSSPSSSSFNGNDTDVQKRDLYPSSLGIGTDDTNDDNNAGGGEGLGATVRHIQQLMRERTSRRQQRRERRAAAVAAARQTRIMEMLKTSPHFRNLFEGAGLGDYSPSRELARYEAELAHRRQRRQEVEALSLLATPAAASLSPPPARGGQGPSSSSTTNVSAAAKGSSASNGQVRGVAAKRHQKPPASSLTYKDHVDSSFIPPMQMGGGGGKSGGNGKGIAGSEEKGQRIASAFSASAHSTPLETTANANTNSVSAPTAAASAVWVDEQEDPAAAAEAQRARELKQRQTDLQMAISASAAQSLADAEAAAAARSPANDPAAIPNLGPLPAPLPTDTPSIDTNEHNHEYNEILKKIPVPSTPRLAALKTLREAAYNSAELQASLAEASQKRLLEDTRVRSRGEFGSNEDAVRDVLGLQPRRVAGFSVAAAVTGATSATGGALASAAAGSSGGERKSKKRRGADGGGRYSSAINSLTFSNVCGAGGEGEANTMVGIDESRRFLGFRTRTIDQTYKDLERRDRMAQRGGVESSPSGSSCSSSSASEYSSSDDSGGDAAHDRPSSSSALPNVNSISAATRRATALFLDVSAVPREPPHNLTRSGGEAALKAAGAAADTEDERRKDYVHVFLDRRGANELFSQANDGAVLTSDGMHAAETFLQNASAFSSAIAGSATSPPSLGNVTPPPTSAAVSRSASLGKRDTATDKESKKRRGGENNKSSSKRSKKKKKEEGADDEDVCDVSEYLDDAGIDAFAAERHRELRDLVFGNSVEELLKRLFKSYATVRDLKGMLLRLQGNHAAYLSAEHERYAEFMRSIEQRAAARVTEAEAAAEALRKQLAADARDYMNRLIESEREANKHRDAFNTLSAASKDKIEGLERRVRDLEAAAAAAKSAETAAADRHAAAEAALRDEVEELRHERNRLSDRLAEADADNAFLSEHLQTLLDSVALTERCDVKGNPRGCSIAVAIKRAGGGGGGTSAPARLSAFSPVDSLPTAATTAGDSGSAAPPPQPQRTPSALSVLSAASYPLLFVPPSKAPLYSNGTARLLLNEPASAYRLVRREDPPPGHADGNCQVDVVDLTGEPPAEERLEAAVEALGRAEAEQKRLRSVEVILRETVVDRTLLEERFAAQSAELERLTGVHKRSVQKMIRNIGDVLVLRAKVSRQTRQLSSQRQYIGEIVDSNAWLRERLEAAQQRRLRKRPLYDLDGGDSEGEEGATNGTANANVNTIEYDIADASTQKSLDDSFIAGAFAQSIMNLYATEFAKANPPPPGSAEAQYRTIPVAVVRHHAAFSAGDNSRLADIPTARTILAKVLKYDHYSHHHASPSSSPSSAFSAALATNNGVALQQAVTSGGGGGLWGPASAFHPSPSTGLMPSPHLGGGFAVATPSARTPLLSPAGATTGDFSLTLPPAVASAAGGAAEGVAPPLLSPLLSPRSLGGDGGTSGGSPIVRDSPTSALGAQLKTAINVSAAETASAGSASVPAASPLSPTSGPTSLAPNGNTSNITNSFAGTAFLCPNPTGPLPAFLGGRLLGWSSKGVQCRDEDIQTAMLGADAVSNKLKAVRMGDLRAAGERKKAAEVSRALKALTGGGGVSPNSAAASLASSVSAASHLLSPPNTNRLTASSQRQRSGGKGNGAPLQRRATAAGTSSAHLQQQSQHQSTNKGARNSSTVSSSPPTSPLPDGAAAADSLHRRTSLASSANLHRQVVGGGSGEFASTLRLSGDTIESLAHIIGNGGGVTASAEDGVVNGLPLLADEEEEGEDEGEGFRVAPDGGGNALRTARPAEETIVRPSSASGDSLRRRRSGGLPHRRPGSAAASAGMRVRLPIGASDASHHLPPRPQSAAATAAFRATSSSSSLAGGKGGGSAATASATARGASSSNGSGHSSQNLSVVGVPPSRHDAEAIVTAAPPTRYAMLSARAAMADEASHAWRDAADGGAGSAAAAALADGFYDSHPLFTAVEKTRSSSAAAAVAGGTAAGGSCEQGEEAKGPPLFLFSETERSVAEATAELLDISNKPKSSLYSNGINHSHRDNSNNGSGHTMKDVDSAFVRLSRPANSSGTHNNASSLPHTAAASGNASSFSTNIFVNSSSNINGHGSGSNNGHSVRSHNALPSKEREALERQYKFDFSSTTSTATAGATAAHRGDTAGATALPNAAPYGLYDDGGGVSFASNGSEGVLSPTAAAAAADAKRSRPASAAASGGGGGATAAEISAIVRRNAASVAAAHGIRPSSASSLGGGLPRGGDVSAASNGGNASVAAAAANSFLTGVPNSASNSLLARATERTSTVLAGAWRNRKV